LYVLASAAVTPFMEAHPEGARVGISRVPVKPSFFATIKSCNYLPNVLMKKEAVDTGVDFCVGLDEDGALAEGPTENIGLVTGDLRLLFPEDRRILPGTTMERVISLAEGLVGSKRLASIGRDRLSLADAAAAREILIAGTSPDVVAVTVFDGRPVGTGKPGPVYQALRRLLADDILGNPAARTPLFA
jgi:branched-chain amino acid aminotransferase